MEQDVKVGIGVIDITPKNKDLLISGGLYTREYDEIKDPLLVKTMVMALQGEKIAFITLDLLGIYNNEHIFKIKTELEKLTDIPSQNILISTSHTHSSPYTDTTRFEYPFQYLEKEIKLHNEYMEEVCEAIISSVLEANNNLEECKIGIAKGKVEGVSHHRRILKDENDCWNIWLLKSGERDKFPPAGPVDTDLLMLVAVTKDEKIKIILYNFALHANSNRTPRTISADYPAYVQDEVRKHLGEQVITLYLPGACGNINPNYPVEFVGEKIGKEIVECMKAVDYNIKPSFYVKSIEAKLPSRKIPDGNPMHFQEEEIKRKWPSGFEFFQGRYQRLKGEIGDEINASLTGVKISDDIALITNPSEFFTELGMDIKDNSPFKYTFVIQLTNGAIDYIPTKRAFDQGGYETFFGASKVEPGAGEIVVEESLKILEELKNI
jgi:neutral ceramidase